MRLLVITSIVTALLACGSDRKRGHQTASALYSSSDSASANSRELRPRNPAAAVLQGITVTAAPSEWIWHPPADSTANMVIRTATASVEVDSLEIAIAQLKALATRIGGYVGNSQIEVGKRQQRQGEIEMKVPATRFEEALSGLTPIGRLESVNAEAEDVGEEFVDVTARMENAKRLEQRLIQLLGTRTGKLKDVLAVEESLARVREEIERHEGRIRYLKAHVAMSTLSVTVHEPFPVVGTAGKSVMGEAVTQAWRNFVGLIAFAVQSLGVVVPLTVLAMAAWMLTKRMRLAKQRTA